MCQYDLFKQQVPNFKLLFSAIGAFAELNHFHGPHLNNAMIDTYKVKRYPFQDINFRNGHRFFSKPNTVQWQAVICGVLNIMLWGARHNIIFLYHSMKTL